MTLLYLDREVVVMKFRQAVMSLDSKNLVTMTLLDDDSIGVVSYRLNEETGYFHPVVTLIYEVGENGAFVLSEKKVH